MLELWISVHPYTKLCYHRGFQGMTLAFFCSAIMLRQRVHLLTMIHQFIPGDPASRIHDTLQCGLVLKFQSCERQHTREPGRVQCMTSSGRPSKIKVPHVPICLHLIHVSLDFSILLGGRIHLSGLCRSPLVAFSGHSRLSTANGLNLALEEVARPSRVKNSDRECTKGRRTCRLTIAKV